MSEIKKLQKERDKALNQGLIKEAASACNALGNEYFNLEKYEEALTEHEKELELCAVTEDQLGIAVSHRRIGECHAMLNDFKKALTHVRKFYDIAVSLKSDIETQRAWATFGRTYYLKYLHDISIGGSNTHSKTLDKAELAYYKALKLSHTLGDEIKPVELAEMKCRLLLNLGLICEIRGDSKQSALHIKQGLDIAKKNNLYEDIHRCSFALGTLFQKDDDHIEAVNAFDVALTATRKLHKKSITSEVLLSKGLSLISLEKYEEAKTALKAAYKLCIKNSDDYEKVARTLKVCIGLCDTQKKLNKSKDLKEKKLLLEKTADGLSSISCYKMAIKKYFLTLDCIEEMNLSPSDKAPIYYSLAQTYHDDNNNTKALEYFEKEYECNKEKPLEQVSTLWRLIEIQEKEGNVKKVEKLYLKAVSLCEEIGDKKMLHRSLSKLLDFYKSINEDLKADDIKQKLEGIKFECSSEDESEDDEEESQDPFGDICISDLSDSNDDEEIISSKRRTKKIEAKVNDKGETPLQQACINGNLSLVKKYVENGHSVNVRDYCGWTPLHEACNYGFYDIVEYLLDKGANINDPGGSECGGITALHDAASCGNFDVMHLLIRRGASVTVKDKNGETPFDALLQWKKRTLRELDDNTLQECKAMEDELKSKMRESGLNVDIGRFSTDIGHIESDEEERISLRSGDKRPRSPSLDSEEDSDEDVSDCTPPYFNDQVWDAANDAQAEYKSVMENLRRSAAGLSPAKKETPAVKVNTGPSLVDEKEVVTEWLIKDTNQPPRTKRKKRKMAKLNVRTSKRIDNYLLQDDPAKANEQSSFITEIEDDSNISISSINSLSKNKENSSQSPKSDVLKLSFSLRVRIADKLILVPIPDESCTISWLSEEAAQRFENFEGIKPHLTLTKDGAMLSGSDLVHSIFSNNEEVFTSIERWDEPSLSDKYAQLCKKYKLAESSNIKKRFQNCEISSELNFSNCNIPPTHLAVIFNTILNCKTIQHLNFSGTFLNDTVITQLIDGFKFFSNLVSLNLSCCSLSSESLKSITDFIANQTFKNNVLPSLKSLDLSFNDFSFISCVSSLLTLNSIISINLSSCGLPSSVFTNNTFKDALTQKQNLEELNISGNILNEDAVLDLLSYLPKNNLKKLNLDHIVRKEINLGHKLLVFFDNILPSLSELSLKGCYLTDTDINYIIKCLSLCPQLQIFDLSANPSLSCQSLLKLLKKLSEYNLNISDLNISGTCEWNDCDLIDFTDIFRSKQFQRLQHLCLDNCSESIREKLKEIWSSKWGKEVVCLNCGFCDLGIK